MYSFSRLSRLVTMPPKSAPVHPPNGVFFWSRVRFDIAPIFGALRYFGAENKRRAWQEAFATFSGPFSYELHELNVTTQGEELAFVHSFNHVRAALASGQITEMWVRWTACFRRIDGDWLVVHDHVSVPADLEHGRAVLDLTP